MPIEFADGDWVDKAFYVLKNEMGWSAPHRVGNICEKEGTAFCDFQCDGDCKLCNKQGGHDNNFKLEYRGPDEEGLYSLSISSHSPTCGVKTGLFDGLEVDKFLSNISHVQGAFKTNEPYAKLYGRLSNADVKFYVHTNKLYKSTPSRWEHVQEATAKCHMSTTLMQFVDEQKAALVRLRAFATELKLSPRATGRLNAYIKNLDKAWCLVRENGFLGAVYNMYKGWHSTEQSFVFDECPTALHFRNGLTLDLTTFETRPTRPDDYNTLICGEYDWPAEGLDVDTEESRAADAVVEEFFGQLFPHPEVRQVAHMILGYNISGERGLKRFVNYTDVLGGNNGKSQLKTAVEIALGTDEGKVLTAVPAFMYKSSDKAGDHTSYLIEMAGKTCCFLEELDPSRAFDSNRLKDYTNGTVKKERARAAHSANHMPVKLMAKFSFAFNEGRAPNWDLTDDAFTSRMLVIPMMAKFLPAGNRKLVREETRFPRPAMRKFFEAKPNFVANVLGSKGAAILRWLVKGYKAIKSGNNMDMLADDNQLPKAVAEFKDVFLLQTPKMKTYFEEKLAEDPHTRSMQAEWIWDDWQNFRDKEKNLKKMTRTEFFKCLKAYVDGVVPGSYNKVSIPAAVPGQRPLARDEIIGWNWRKNVLMMHRDENRPSPARPVNRRPFDGMGGGGSPQERSSGGYPCPRD